MSASFLLKPADIDLHCSQQSLQKFEKVKYKLHLFSKKMGIKLKDNCIQNLHLGRYIVKYTVGNQVLRRRAS